MGYGGVPTPSVSLGAIRIASGVRWGPEGPGAAGLAMASALAFRRYEEGNDPADLAASIELVRAAVESTPRGHPDRATYLIALGSGLFAEHLRTYEPGPVDEAVEVFRAAGAQDNPAYALALLGQADARMDEPLMVAAIAALRAVGEPFLRQAADGVLREAP